MITIMILTITGIPIMTNDRPVPELVGVVVNKGVGIWELNKDEDEDEEEGEGTALLLEEGRCISV